MPLPVIVGGLAAGAYVVSKIIDVVGTATAAVRKNVPILDDQVVVEVSGQPGSSKQELYYLALATANGIVRRFQPLLVVNPAVPPTMALLQIEYDAADSWVRCTIHYRVGTLAANVRTGARTGKDFYDTLAVYRGPQCGVVGGTFDFVDPSILPGIPNQDKAPILPWAGRSILTSCPTTQQPVVSPITQDPPATETLIQTQTITSPNPKPPGDNRSRGAVYVEGSIGDDPQAKCCPKKINLVQLVSAALTDPGSDAETKFNPPTAGPTGV